MQLSANAKELLNKRYLLKDPKGQIIESPEQMFKRVARNISKVDAVYGEDNKKSMQEFYDVMTKLDFLPNSPTLMNAGTKIQQLSACFVLPVEDSIEEIFEAVEDMAKIHQSGGGTGFSFSKIRPKGDLVSSTKGKASGPVSFIRVFDTATDVVKQGGKRRGANMAVLSIYHPDIIEFIIAKKHGLFKNFNFSVSADKRFFNAAKKNKKIDLINPRTGKSMKNIDAKSLLDLIVDSAWRCGDPGILFIDEINKKNILKRSGNIKATNPCGEQPLLDHESCNLGSINLANMIKDKKIDWDKLKKTIRIAVHFLDNVIDASRYPSYKIEDMTRSNRKIGLGIMGFADMLIKLRIKYDSSEGVRIAEIVMKFISDEAKKKSAEIGRKRGSFPNIKKSSLLKRYKAMRNATVTTIAPTGSISIIAGCSSGIEPLFALSFTRECLDGKLMIEMNDDLKKDVKEKKIYSKRFMQEVIKKGSVQDIRCRQVPKDIKDIFVTAYDIRPEWHVKMQAAFQKYVDNAVSKTVNIRSDATRKDIKKIFLLAQELRCKGITVYRKGSKKDQVLNVGRSIKRCKVCS